MTYSIQNTLDYSAIKTLGSIDLNSDHEFDLSKVTFARPDGIVLLRLIFHKICKENGRKIIVVLPEKNSTGYSVRRYLAHINFFDNISIGLLKKDLLYLKSRKIWPGSSSLTHTKLIDNNSYDIKSEMVKFVMVLVNFLKSNNLINENLENVYRMIFDEAFENLREHSVPGEKGKAYFCAQAQVYKQSRIVLSIGDNGVGVLNSLNTVFNYTSDREALKAAVEERKSRIIENTNKGGGLRFIFDKCWNLDINCLLKSGTTEIKLLKGDKKFRYSATPFFPGTQLFLWN